jgi:hypothetical protein
MKTIKIIVVVIVVIAVLLVLLRTIPGVRYVSDFFTPIVFCGKVVDEKGNPVPSADVVASFANTPGEGHAENKLVSDSQGQFWTWGFGLGIVIDVSKTGYY